MHLINSGGRAADQRDLHSKHIRFFDGKIPSVARIEAIILKGRNHSLLFDHQKSQIRRSCPFNLGMIVQGGSA
jgi:hypothetical protein